MNRRHMAPIFFNPLSLMIGAAQAPQYMRATWQFPSSLFLANDCNDEEKLHDCHLAHHSFSLSLAKLSSSSFLSLGQHSPSFALFLLTLHPHFTLSRILSFLVSLSVSCSLFPSRFRWAPACKACFPACLQGKVVHLLRLEVKIYGAVMLGNACMLSDLGDSRPVRVRVWFGACEGTKYGFFSLGTAI